MTIYNPVICIYKLTLEGMSTMKKSLKKINKATKVLAFSLFSVATVLTVDKGLHETILLNSDVDAASVSKLIADLTDDGPILDRLITTRFIIDSNGGSVRQLDLLKAVIKSHYRYIETELHGMAASAAADLFLVGDKRYMGKDAQVLFHEVRIMLGGGFFGGGIMVTYTDFDSLLKTGKFASNSKIKGAEEVVLKALKDAGASLEEVVKSLKTSHEEHIAYLMDRLNMSRQEVTTKLLVPNEDIVFNQEQALALGVATHSL